MKTVLLLGALASLAISRSFGCGGSFDEAPPTLDYYLDRLPGKSLGEIFVETTSASAPANFVQVPEAVSAIAARAKTEPSKTLIAEVDSLLAQVRATGGNHEELARLHDLRDGLVTSPTTCSEYMTWRIDRTNLIKPELKRDPWYNAPEAPGQIPSNLTGEIEKHAADDHDPLQAHWLYLRGAVAFNYLDKVDAQKWFDKVVQEFPDDPRAEIALFMSGRCLLAQSRASIDYSLPQNVRERIEAESKAKAADARVRFRRYLEKYPEGRFVADAYGWLGALDEGVASLDDYIRQVETPGHPEVLKSGVMMIQKRLDDFDFTTLEGEQAIYLVSKHPKVAMNLLYQVLGARADDDRDDISEQKSGIPPLARMKKWRNTILPKLAAAVASRENLYAPPEIWQPRYLAILAHAASASGDQQSAINLTSMSPKNLDESDDLLFARAIALQRANKFSDALAAFQEFLKRFPNSPLARGARIRFAIALRDNHESGRAVLELSKLLGEQLSGTASQYSGTVYPPGDDGLKLTDSPLRHDITNAEEEQVRQVIDTMLLYAPLPELAAALNDTTIDPVFADQLKAIIVSRALALEDFAMARKFMNPEEFAGSAEHLDTLTARVNSTKNPASKAKLEAQLGDSWAALRWKILPLKGLPADFRNEPELAEINRRTNGKALGYAQVEKTLDEQDELRHASRWWLRAARLAPATPLSASCRLKALESIAKVAAGSDYAFQRAIEDDSAKTSREIYEKLLAESPGSIEAKQAAYWTFPLPDSNAGNNTDRSGFAGNFFSDRWWQAGQRLRSGYYWDDYELLGQGMSQYFEYTSDQKKWADIRKRVLALRDSQKTVPEFATEIAEIRDAARAIFHSESEAACLNFLEDLVLFLGEPQITDAMAHRYIELRLDVLRESSWPHAPVVPDPGKGGNIRSRIASAASDPVMSQVSDYLAVLDAAVVANTLVEIPITEDAKETTISSRDYPALEKMMRDFLDRYPQSRKREAARLLLARAVYRQSWPRLNKFTSDSGEVRIEEFQSEPLNPERVLAELDAYDREFPDGRYSPQIRDMRASVCWRSGDWKTALDLTVRQLDERVPDLQRDGALRLSNIFAELANPKHRPVLMGAIRQNQSAKVWLKAYLHTAPNYREHPLRFLGGYLQNQFGFTLPDPMAQVAN